MLTHSLHRKHSAGLSLSHLNKPLFCEYTQNVKLEIY